MDGMQIYNITEDPQHFDWDHDNDTGTFALDNRGEELFTVGVKTWYFIQIYLERVLNGSITSDIQYKLDVEKSLPRGGFFESGSPFMTSIWNASTDPDKFISDVATTLTNYLRMADPNAKEQPGRAYAIGVTVTWHWLILPAVLTLSSIILLIATITRTSRSGMPPWKTSLLRVMLIDMDESVRHACGDRADTYNAVEDAVGSWNAKLVEQPGRRWKLEVT